MYYDKNHAKHLYKGNIMPYYLLDIFSSRTRNNLVSESGNIGNGVKIEDKTKFSPKFLANMQFLLYLCRLIMQ